MCWTRWRAIELADGQSMRKVFLRFTNRAQNDCNNIYEAQYYCTEK